MSDKDTAVFSPMAAPSPAASDEAQGVTVDQPAVDAAPVEAADVRPPDPAGTQAEPVATNWEQRAKDTQRALSEREVKLHQLEGKLEVLERQFGSGSNAAPVRDVKAEIEKLEEDVRNDPANAVRHFYQVLAERDAYFNGALANIKTDFERKAIERDPDYKAVEASLKLVQDIPEFAQLSLGAQVEVAKRMQAKTSGVQMRPPGGVGQQRVAAQQKPVTPEERFGAYLRASGAIKSTAPKGVVAFQFDGRK